MYNALGLESVILGSEPFQTVVRKAQILSRTSNVSPIALFKALAGVPRPGKAARPYSLYSKQSITLISPHLEQDAYSCSQTRGC